MNVLDLLLFALLGLLIGYLIGRIKVWVVNQITQMQADQLQKVLDNSLFVTVEKYEASGNVTYLMYNLVDDKFLLQAPTPAELVKKVKEKYPNKAIMVHGDDTIAAIPEFGEHLQKV